MFSAGRADYLAGWGGGMPRYFRRGRAAASRGFRWFQMVSGPAFRACFPARRRVWSVPPPGRFHRCCRGAAGRPSGPSGKQVRRASFCPFCPAFSGPEGGAGDPGRGDFSPGCKKRACVRKVRGGIRLRVVGSARPALCNERSFRTDVSFCTICRYGSDRAGV